MFVALAIDFVLATITFLKKKPFMGILALLLAFVGVVTATRLAKPGSPWAHWFYDPDRGGGHGRGRGVCGSWSGASTGSAKAGGAASSAGSRT